MLRGVVRGVSFDPDRGVLGVRGDARGDERGDQRGDARGDLRGERRRPNVQVAPSPFAAKVA